MSETMGQTEG